MSIPKNTGSITKPASSNDAALLATQSQREQDEALRTQNMLDNQNQVMSLSILSVILSIFTNIGNGNSSLDKISDAFGLKTGTLRRAANQIVSGETDARTVAHSVHKNVNTSNVDWSKAKDVDLSEIVDKTGQSPVLNPELIDRMLADPKICQMVKWTFESAERNGIDGNLLANQYWQESSYRPHVVSPMGARGISQIMPFHKGKYGLESDADFFDPKSSIEAGAQAMKERLDKHGGDYKLALAEYNGGKGAIAFADKNIVGDGIDGDQWVEFNEHRLATKGVTSESAWHVESLAYVKRICPEYWSKEKLAKAEVKMSKLQQQFAKGGVAENDPKQPNPLKPEHDKTIASGGTDEVKVAAAKDAEQPQSDDPSVTSTTGITV